MPIQGQEMPPTWIFPWDLISKLKLSAKPTKTVQVKHHSAIGMVPARLAIRIGSVKMAPQERLYAHHLSALSA
jgi:hypothetical protein